MQRGSATALLTITVVNNITVLSDNFYGMLVKISVGLTADFRVMQLETLVGKNKLCADTSGFNRIVI